MKMLFIESNTIFPIVGIAETNIYFMISVLIILAIFLYIRYIGMILSLILSASTLFVGITYWTRFGFGMVWSQQILIVLLISFSIKCYLQSIFKVHTIYNLSIRRDYYVWSDITLSDVRKYQAILYLFPAVVFFYFIHIEPALLELINADPVKMGLMVVNGIPFLGWLVSIAYFISILIEGSIGGGIPARDLLLVYYNCVTFYLVLIAIFSILSWKKMFLLATIQIGCYSLPLIMIILWLWELPLAITYIILYIVLLSIIIIPLFYFQSSELLEKLRVEVNNKILKVKIYIAKISVESEEVEDSSQPDSFQSSPKKHKNRVKWSKLKNESKIAKFPRFLGRKVVWLGHWIQSTTLTVNLRVLKQKQEYTSFKEKYRDLYLSCIKYLILFGLTLLAYIILAEVFPMVSTYSEITSVVQNSSHQVPFLIFSTGLILGATYILLIILHYWLLYLLRRYRKVVIYEEPTSWGEIASDNLMMAHTYTKNRVYRKSIRHLVLTLYYTLLDDIDYIGGHYIWYLKKGARAYRKRKLDKALRYLDIASRGAYLDDLLNSIGHIYDLIGNYYVNQENNSMAIEYYRNSKNFNAQAENWSEVNRMEKKIKHKITNS